MFDLYLQVHVAVVIEMPYNYIKLTLNSQLWHNYLYFSFRVLDNILNYVQQILNMFKF